jgi:hypothetical protein
MNQLAVAIAIVLFPGLIASVICDKVTVHYQRWDIFKYGIYSFVLGLFCYTLLQGVAMALDSVDRILPGVEAAKNGRLSAWTLVTTEKYKIDLAEVLWATILAPFVAASAAAIVNLKLITRIAGKFGISDKYGDENLYSFFLNSKNVDWVYVRDRDMKVTYFGRVVSFSEYGAVQELALENVDVFDLDTSTLLYSIKAIYLTKPMGQFIIEIP